METTGWYLSIGMCFVLVYCCVSMLMTSCFGGTKPILGRKRITLPEPDPLILAEFFHPPPPFRWVFFHQSCIPLPCIASLSLPGVKRKTSIYSPLPPSYTSSSTYMQSYIIFDGADGVRGRRREGRREKRGGSRKRGEKCKDMEGREKGKKKIRAPLRDERREKRGRRGEAYSLSTPHIWKYRQRFIWF